MNRKAILFFLSILLILAFSNLRGASFFSSKNALDLKRIDGSELGTVPPVEETIRFFQARIKKNPQDAVSYHLLAAQYVRQARETGDVAGYQRAETALKEALRLAPNYGQANASLASVHYAQHDFLPALELAQQVYEKNPKITDALATIGDAQLALGYYREAEAAYRELSEKVATPPVLARLAALEELKGNPETALELMHRAAEGAVQAGGTQESVAWYVLRVGDMYFNMGQYKQAGNHYEAALRIFDNYHLALAGLGKVRAAQSRYEEAIDYYERAIQMVPQPEYLAALGDLYSMTSHPEQAQLQYRTVEYIGKLAGLNQQIYNRQLANFYSDHDLHLKEALRLALAELDVRKDIYGYDAAAWAQYKNDHFEEAQALMAHALSLGTRDARLYYHAGMIEHALGNDQAARNLLEEALSINPQFSVLEAEEARRTLETLQ
ncbi:MAG TPA: tetratricopeptide repeat protein [Anaerolineales bacterium]|nr:tetratricopeptide repeat protein [Anaerolineales bacterium]